MHDDGNGGKPIERKQKGKKNSNYLERYQFRARNDNNNDDDDDGAERHWNNEIYNFTSSFKKLGS